MEKDAKVILVKVIILLCGALVLGAIVTMMDVGQVAPNTQHNLSVVQDDSGIIPASVGGGATVYKNGNETILFIPSGSDGKPAKGTWGLNNYHYAIDPNTNERLEVVVGGDCRIVITNYYKLS